MRYNSKQVNKIKRLKKDNAFTAATAQRNPVFGEREKGRVKDITLLADPTNRHARSNRVRSRSPLSLAANDSLFWWLFPTFCSRRVSKARRLLFYKKPYCKEKIVCLCTRKWTRL